MARDSFSEQSSTVFGGHDGLFYMSTWLSYEILRHLVKHYSECLWNCFWIRVTFKSVEWVKQIALSPYCGWASSDQLKTWTKPKLSRGNSSCPTCWAGTLVFSGFWTQMKTLTLLESWACWTLDWNTISFPGSQVSRLKLGLHISSPGSPIS